MRADARSCPVSGFIFLCFETVFHSGIMFAMSFFAKLRPGVWSAAQPSCGVSLLYIFRIVWRDGGDILKLICMTLDSGYNYTPSQVYIDDLTSRYTASVFYVVRPRSLSAAFGGF